MDSAETVTRLVGPAGGERAKRRICYGLGNQWHTLQTLLREVDVVGEKLEGSLGRHLDGGPGSRGQGEDGCWGEVDERKNMGWGKQMTFTSDRQSCSVSGGVGHGIWH